MNYLSRYNVKILGVTVNQQSYTFPAEAKSVKISNSSGSAATAYITLSERALSGVDGFEIENVDTTQADEKTISLVAGEYTILSLDSNKINYKCAADTATLQLVTMSERG